MDQASATTATTAYERNPSLFGLALGAAAGAVDGALAHGAAAVFIMEAREAALLLYLACSGLMVGAFFGGLIGLRAHGAAWSRSRTLRTLASAQAAFLALLLLAIVAQALSG